MQSAADRSVNRGVLSPDAGSEVEPPGMTVVARTTGGGTGMEEVEYVQGVPVAAGRVVLEVSDTPRSPMAGVGIDINPLQAGGMGGGGGTGQQLFGETIGEVGLLLATIVEVLEDLVAMRSCCCCDPDFVRGWWKFAL